MTIIEFVKARKFLSIIIGLLVVAIVVLLAILQLNQSPQKALNSQLKNEELDYPVAPPQDYKNPSIKIGGAVITSNPTGARVMIDPAEEEVSVGSNNSLVNVTPFRVNAIPEGTHVITAFLNGYELYEGSLEVKAGEVVRFEIVLIETVTIDDFTPGTKEYRDFWIKQLPLENQNYKVEYIKETDSLKATLTPPPAVQVSRAEQIRFLQNRVRFDLQNLGVDVDKEKIEWVTLERGE